MAGKYALCSTLRTLEKYVFKPCNYPKKIDISPISHLAILLANNQIKRQAKTHLSYYIKPSHLLIYE